MPDDRPRRRPTLDSDGSHVNWEDMEIIEDSNVPDGEIHMSYTASPPIGYIYDDRVEYPPQRHPRINNLPREIINDIYNTSQGAEEAEDRLQRACYEIFGSPDHERNKPKRKPRPKPNIRLQCGICHWNYTGGGDKRHTMSSVLGWGSDGDGWNKIVCKQCLTNVGVCCECNKTVWNGQRLDHDNSAYCRICFNDRFKICSSCNNTFPKNDVITIRNYGGHWCQECYDKTFIECGMDGCGRIIDRQHDSYSINHNGSSIRVCRGCYEEEVPKGIRNYTYRPRMKPKGYDKLKFGIELEVECHHDQSADDHAYELNKRLNGFIYCKSDSSIEYGFEIVSHPASLSYWKKIAYLNPIFELRDLGFKSGQTDTCGMHVHMSQDCFTSVHTFKFMKFFDSNRNFVIGISEREPNNFKRWCLNRHPNESVAKQAKDKFNSNRRQMVNLQAQDTVEVRIFKGTLNRGLFMKNLEFCSAVYEYTKIVGIPDADDLKKFGNYIKDKKIYCNLNKFIDKFGLFKGSYLKKFKPRKQKVTKLSVDGEYRTTEDIYRSVSQPVTILAPQPIRSATHWREQFASMSNTSNTSGSQ